MPNKHFYLQHIIFYCILLWSLFETNSLSAQSSTFYIFTTTQEFTVCLNAKQCTQTPSKAILIKNIPNEVLGLEIKASNGITLFKDVVFLNLDTTLYFLLTQQAGKHSLERVASTPLNNPLVVLYNPKGISAEIEPGLTTYPVAQKLEVETDSYQKEALVQTKPSPISYGSIKNKQEKKSKPQPCTKVAEANKIRFVRNEAKKMVGFSAQIKFMIDQFQSYCLYTDQLKDILKTVEEDNSKLEIITSLQYNILNPEKLDALANLFLFEPSIEELLNIQKELLNDK